MDVPQPIWLSGWPMKGHFRAKNAFLAFLTLKWPFIGQPNNYWQPYKLSDIHANPINFLNCNKINLRKFGQTQFTIQKFTKSEFTNFQFKNSKFSLFDTHENQAQMMRWYEIYGWDSTYMITTMLLMHINLLHSAV